MVNIKKNNFSLNKFFLKFFILFMGSLCLLSTSVFALQADEELLFHYDFEGDTSDKTGNQPSLSSPTITNSHKVFGDSAGYLYYARETFYKNLNELGVTGQDFSFSFWFRPINGGDAYDDFFSTEVNGAPDGTFLARFRDLDDRILTYFRDNGQWDVSQDYFYNSNNWYHVTFTFNNGNTKTYINGNLQTSHTSNEFFSNADVYLFGRVTSDNTRPYGYIDDYVLFNKELDSTEVTSLHNNGVEYGSNNGIKTDIKEFYNSSSFDIEINTSNIGNLSYSLDNGTLTSICNDCNNSILNLNSLSEGSHSILLESNDENGQVNKTYNFTIDLTKPSLDVNITEINSYILNLSSKVSYNDSNLDKCLVSGDYNGTCQDIITFTTNGNKSLFFNVSDLAGNINTTNISFLVNPTQYIYFENSTNDKLTNFTINNVSYTDKFNFNVYDYGLGSKNFTFRKGGYKEFNFNINITNNSNINTTYYPEAPFINISIKDLLTGNLATKDDFTLVVYNENDDISKTYEITNNNIFQFRNFYAVNKNLVLNLVDKNDTVITNKEIVAPFKDTNINFYTTTEDTLVKNFEVLNKNLRKIKFEDVKLYAYLKNGEFVHLATKETDIDGTVSFNVVQSKIFYTICHTDQDNDQACLNQISFDDIKDDYQIIHLSNIKGNTRNILEYLEWSIDEEKTNTTSKILFYYEDKQTNVDSFCYDVSRIKNNTVTFSESKCSNNYEGLLTQTYSLSNNEVLEYSFYYVIGNQSYLLNKFTSYPTSQAIDYFSSLGIFNLLFLLISLAAIGFLLNTDDFDIYTLGFLVIMLIISLVQAYFNKDYISLGTWSFMVMQKFFVYIVRAD